MGIDVIFFRYVDNVNNNEITQSGSTTITQGQPRSSGNIVSVDSRLTFKPTLDDLCRYYITLTAGFIFVRTIFVQNGKCSPFLELTPTL